jgi:hypothetical protein
MEKAKIKLPDGDILPREHVEVRKRSSRNECVIFVMLFYNALGEIAPVYNNRSITSIGVILVICNMHRMHKLTVRNKNIDQCLNQSHYHPM